MKKIVVYSLSILGLLSGVVFAQISDKEFDEALNWMSEAGITKYATQSEYMPEASMTREQGAKLIGVYLDGAGYSFEKTNNDCIFSDESAIDETLLSWVEKMCGAGYMKGWSGAFHPSLTMSKAEVLTVLVRSTDGLKNEEVTPWWLGYVETAQQSGLTNERTMSRFELPVSRYEIALLLWRMHTGSPAPEKQPTQTNEYDKEQSELIDLFEQLLSPTK